MAFYIPVNLETRTATAATTLEFEDILVIENILIQGDGVGCHVFFYGISNSINFASVREARDSLARLAVRFSNSHLGSRFINPRNPIYRAYSNAVTYHGAIDSSISQDVGAYVARDFNGIISTFLSDNMVPSLAVVDLQTATANDDPNFNLLARAIATYNRTNGRGDVFDVNLLSDNPEEFITPLAPPPEQLRVPIFTITPVWEELGFESQDEFDEIVLDFYYDLLDQDDIDEQDLSSSEVRTYRDTARKNVIAHYKSLKLEQEKMSSDRVLKFKDLLYVNIGGKSKPAICLADIPKVESFSINIPVMIKEGNDYLNAKVPFVNILKKVPTLEEIATRVKIVGYKESGEVFGYKKTKEGVVGNIYSFVEIEKGFQCKKDNITRDTIIVDLGKSNFRFVLSDVEFVLPTVNRVQLKKDKSIRIGSICKVIRNKGLTVPVGNKVTIIDLKNTPQGNSSKKLFRDSKNRRLDLATVQDIESGKTFRTYLKNLKFIQ
jgi:hypothetical protein